MEVRPSGPCRPALSASVTWASPFVQAVSSERKRLDTLLLWAVVVGTHPAQPVPPSSAIAPLARSPLPWLNVANHGGAGHP